MLKYRGYSIKQVVSIATSVQEALARTPDFWLVTDGVTWYRNAANGIAKVGPELAQTLNALPMVQA